MRNHNSIQGTCLLFLISLTPAKPPGTSSISTKSLPCLNISLHLCLRISRDNRSLLLSSETLKTNKAVSQIFCHATSSLSKDPCKIFPIFHTTVSILVMIFSVTYPPWNQWTFLVFFTLVNFFSSLVTHPPLLWLPMEHILCNKLFLISSLQNSKSPLIQTALTGEIV